MLPKRDYNVNEVIETINIHKLTIVTEYVHFKKKLFLNNLDASLIEEYCLNSLKIKITNNHRDYH